MRSVHRKFSIIEATMPRRRGIVLVLVLIVVVMISLSGFSFVAAMLHENKAVHVRGEQLQMEYALDSAEEYLKQIIDRPKSSGPITPSDTAAMPGANVPPLEDEQLMRGIVVVDDEPYGRVRFTVVAPRYEESDSSKWTYGLTRESSRLDMRSVMMWEASQPGSGRMALLQLPGMTESTADALLDWIDADRVPRASGAEDEYYATLNPPYAPRNGLPESLEELLLVKGVSRELLFGDDADQNHRLQWNERQSSTSKSERERSAADDEPWSELLTLHSGERNQTRDGQPRIALNDPNLALLHAKVTAAFDAKLATFIVLYRQYGPVMSAATTPGPARSAALAAVQNRGATNTVTTSAPPKGPATASTIATTDLTKIQPNFAIPAQFDIRSPLDLIDSQVQTPPAAGNTGLVASPLPTDRAQSNPILADLCDRLTTIDGPVVRGRINVNLAPASVLRTIPGMDSALANQIVASRAAKAPRNPNRDAHPAWLYTEGMVNLSRMKELFPYLTTGGDVYRAQIVAFSESSRLSQRIEIVLDATATPVRRVFKNDLQVLGRGYPWDVLDTPAGIAATPTGVANATPARNR